MYLNSFFCCLECAAPLRVELEGWRWRDGGGGLHSPDLSSAKFRRLEQFKSEYKRYGITKPAVPNKSGLARRN